MGGSIYSGTTHSLNIVAEWISIETRNYNRTRTSSNILPWMKQGRTALNGLLVVVPANDEGSINIEDWETACKTHLVQ